MDPFFLSFVILPKKKKNELLDRTKALIVVVVRIERTMKPYLSSCHASCGMNMSLALIV